MSPILDEGDPCPEACDGHLVLPEAEDCSCRISPPCGACMAVRLTCDECGWVETEEPQS